jgi:hypothetical protein
MTRIGRIYADNNKIRFNPPNPRHPRAIKSNILLEVIQDAVAAIA